MITDPYEVLGVAESATQDEIKLAYRNRIREAHPDMPNGNEDLARKLNEAYAVVGDPKSRQAYDEARRNPSSDPDLVACPECGRPIPPFLVELHLRQHLEQRFGPSCSICGRWPTEDLRLTMHSGFLLFRQKREFDGPLCQSCGTGLFRQAQAHNLTRGWWGIISFFATFFSLLGNWAAHSSFKNKVAPPSPTDPQTETILRGRAVFARPGVLVVVGMFAVVAIALANNANTSSPSFNDPGPVSPPPVADPFSTGSCVNYDGQWVEPATTCVGADGRVISVELVSESCPVTADLYVVRDDGRVACISNR